MKLRSAAFLPYARQRINSSDLAAVDQVLRGDYLTTGPAVGKFEAALATGWAPAMQSVARPARLHCILHVWHWLSDPEMP